MTPDQAYRHCRDLTRRAGPNFSVGFRFLPRDKRRATEAAYAFCRYLDDQVDLPGTGSPEDRLMEWEAELDRTYSGNPAHPAGIALADALSRFLIPKTAFRGAHRRLSDGPGEDEVRDIRGADRILRPRRDDDPGHHARHLRREGRQRFASAGRSRRPFSSRTSSATWGKTWTAGGSTCPARSASGSA